jgi:hypothetical protein
MRGLTRRSEPFSWAASMTSPIVQQAKTSGVNSGRANPIC